jgi:thymidine kinase
MVLHRTPRDGGWLEVICGPMFSGKTEELIRRMRRVELERRRALVIKSNLDNRYSVNHLDSHDGSRMRAVAVGHATEVLPLADGYDVVGIDEAQFFDSEIVSVVSELIPLGTRVVAAGLDQDFRGLPFGCMPALLCAAEFVDKLQAVCERCGGPGTMTQRLVGSTPAPMDASTIVVGSRDMYEPRCRRCHEVAPAAAKREVQIAT